MKNNYKQNFIWNSVAGVVNAGESVIILMICMRTFGVEMAGILTIAFAIANLMMAIGKYGMRTYQVTDAKSDFSNSEYLGSRIITVAVMMIASIAVELVNVFAGRHAEYKAVVIVLLCLIYAVESLEDFYVGVFQKEDRLDLGNKIFVARWILIFLIFFFGSIKRYNVIWLEIIAIGISIVIDWILVKYACKKLQIPAIRPVLKNVYELLKRTFPLFLVAFLSLYITNAPKYAIDRYMDETVQASYGFVAMPVFVISLLNSFLYQPLLVDMSVAWENRVLEKLKCMMKKQFMWIAGLTLGVLIGSYILGIPFLEILYHVNLEGYKTVFMLLMLGGGILAVIGYECVVLTVMRKQKFVSIGYLMASFVSVWGFNYCTKYFGIMGNVILYDGLLVMLMLLFTFFIYFRLKRECESQAFRERDR